jgi:hypothetical protein
MTEIGIGIAGMAVPIVIGVGGLLSSNSGSKEEDNVFYFQWFDPLCFYYKFEKQYNDTIDRILMDPLHGRMGNQIAISERVSIPGEGYHTYFHKINTACFEIFNTLFNFNRVTFYKKIKSHNAVELITYYCRVSPFVKLFTDNARDEVFKKIYGTSEAEIRVTSIDTSWAEPRMYIKNQIYKNPTNIQSSIATHMINQYFDEKSNNNVKMLITGERGSQKTFMGKVIKNMLENHPTADGKISATLIDNFNPKDIGVNIETLILCKATYNNPVIILINEFDIVMNHVIDPTKQSFDPRICHAKDKTTFNNMLDNISDTRYCITIFTAEKSVDELKMQSDDFKSFIRKGRVDYYVSMSLNAFRIENAT